MLRPLRLSVFAALLSTAGALACAGSSARSDTPAAPVQMAPPPAGLNVARFEPEIVRFEAADRTSPPAPGGIVFVGSSSIRMWRTLAEDFPGLAVINRGFGGSKVADSVRYANRIVLPYRPRMVVLYAGDNDIPMGRTPAQVADDYRAFVSIVHSALPSARIVFVSVKPAPSRWAFQSSVRETNRLVRAVTAADPLQTFVDVFTPMLGNEGRPRPELFLSDSLHMTPAGYAIWRRQLAPIVR